MKLLTVISSILLSKAGGKGGKSNADFFFFFLMMLNVGGVLPDLVILSHHRDTRRCFLLRRGACFRTKDSDRAAQSRWC